MDLDDVQMANDRGPRETTPPPPKLPEMLDDIKIAVIVGRLDLADWETEFLGRMFSRYKVGIEAELTETQMAALRGIHGRVTA